ncbi:MAG: tRNA dihydrouridine synthase DusB [Clostridia bacterium]|nr:tRNA dihydrouridine synthase DusB [Clostridia bacterium]
MLKIGSVTIPSAAVLGPMAGVTDASFRMICRKYGCGFTCSEMVSAKALYYNDKKTEQLIMPFDDEQPYAVQLFGSDPEIMALAAKKIKDMNVCHIIDINMGCPVPKVANNGDGSALMRNPELAGKIIYSVCNAVDIPVTVKIRKGWDDDSVNAVELAGVAEKNGAMAITVHGRTRQQFYSGEADWDIIREVKKSVSIPVIGNGDIFQFEDIEKMMDFTGCDAVMIARGALGNPFIFSGIKPDLDTIIDTALFHMKCIVRHKGEYIGIREARKHISWYIKGLHGAAKAKNAVNSAESAAEIYDILESLKKKQWREEL